MQQNTTEKRTLLAVLAHPDDESFGIGGTLAYYAQQGVNIELICATKGEVGEMEPQYLHDNLSPSDIRVNELRCAAGILGISKIHFLDYRDSGMVGSSENNHPQALCNQPLESVALRIVEIIRNLKPDLVITFDPIGGYRHPDHIAIHNATVMAYTMAFDPNTACALPPFKPARLLYSTFPKTSLRLMLRMMSLFGKDPRHFGKNGDINLVSIAEVTFPTHYKISYRSVAKARDAAAACHASQGGGGISNGFVAFFRNLFTPYETFMQAQPVYTAKHPQRDIFAGLDKG